MLLGGSVGVSGSAVNLGMAKPPSDRIRAHLPEPSGTSNSGAAVATHVVRLNNASLKLLPCSSVCETGVTALSLVTCFRARSTVLARDG